MMSLKIVIYTQLGHTLIMGLRSMYVCMCVSQNKGTIHIHVSPFYMCASKQYNKQKYAQLGLSVLTFLLICCRNRWHGDVQEYRPKFSDGWQPSDQWLDMFLYANSVGNLVAKQAQNRMSREVEEEPAQHFNVSLKTWIHVSVAQWLIIFLTLLKLEMIVHDPLPALMLC